MKWLNEEGFTTTVSPNPNRFDSYWYSKVTRESASFRIRLPSNRPDSMIVEVNMTFDSENLKAFNRLKQPQKNRFINDLQITLFQTGVRTAILHDGNGNPQMTNVQKEIYFDALTKHLFMTYVLDVLQAVGVASLKFAQFQDSIWSKDTDKR